MKRWLGALAWSAVAVAAAAEPAALGGAPRDAEGRFLNRAGDLERAGPSVTFPFFARRFWTSLAGREGAAARVENDGAFLRENAGHSAPTVTWIGHSTLLLQMDHTTFLTDPTWADRASPVPGFGPRRLVAPGLALEALPPIDFVLLSHDHFDHMDLPTLQALARRGPETRFYVPLGNGRFLREAGVGHVVELDWGGQVTQGGVTIHCLESQHWSRRELDDARRALWSSWAVIGPERRFYFAGDSGFSEGFARIGAALAPFDLAALPIGAYEPSVMMRPFHLDPEEAVRAARELGARRAVAIHWGTFDLSDEPVDEPPRRFRAAARAAGVADDDALVLRVGETAPF